MKYGNGISAGQAFKYDKERIKHALKGEVFAGEDENGFIYKTAQKEVCDREILELFDGAVYQCMKALASGRALERVAKEKMHTSGKDFIQKYMKYEAEENLKDTDYGYEPDIEEDC